MFEVVTCNLLFVYLINLRIFRMVCVALISSDSLEWERTQLWALTFKLIRKIIGGVDYKVSDTKLLAHRRIWIDSSNSFLQFFDCLCFFVLIFSGFIFVDCC